MVCVLLVITADEFVFVVSSVVCITCGLLVDFDWFGCLSCAESWL